MKKNDYKYLACAVALSLSMGVGGQSALAAVDPTNAPMGVGVDLNSGKSATMNSVATISSTIILSIIVCTFTTDFLVNSCVGEGW